MSKILLQSLLAAPAVLGVALVASTSAIAAEANVKAEAIQSQAAALSTQTLSEVSTPEALPVVSTVPAQQPIQVAQAAPVAPANTTSLDQLNRYSREGRSASAMSQVTSVSQLSDVRPTDWAFQALQSLVERYGCIAGYPDRRYRGNQAMTRYEFAAGLNACIDRVNELIAAATADLVKKEDLAVLQKLQEEFAAELATLRGRVDALEARTATLEKQQFSTTTKLAGEVIFAVTDEFRQPVDNNTVFQNRVRLALNTSFTGKDLLVTRLAAGNAGTFAYPGVTTGFSGGEGLQTFNFGNTGGNQVYADWVAYFFPIGENINVYVPAVSGLHYDYAPTNSGFLEGFDSGTAALSIFAQRNPIYLIGGGSGAGITFGTNSPIKISVGYLADNSDGSQTTFAANNPLSKNGLFNGSYSALGQVTFAPSDAFSLGLTYVNAYRRGAIFDGGSALSSFGTSYANGVSKLTPSNVNAYGVSANFKFSPKISISGFASYITSDEIGDGFEAADIWTYGIGVGFADFGKKGNLLGLMAGIEPYVANPRQYGAGTNSRDLPIHVEGFYKYQLTDNISITPGIIWIINPGQNENNTDAIIGTLRTTFTF